MSMLRREICGRLIALAVPLTLATSQAGAQSNSELQKRMFRPPPASVVDERRQQAVNTEKVWPKIINGEDAKRGQFPWQVALIRPWANDGLLVEGHFCGGSLIGWRWVLTAAHCTFAQKEGRMVPLMPEEIHLYAGSHDFTGGQRMEISRIIRHEDYDPRSQDNDVTLLELAQEIKDKTGLKLVRLPTLADEEAWQTGRFGTVIGWGSTIQGRIPAALDLRRSAEILKYARVQFKPSDQCDRNLFQGERQYLGDLLSRDGKAEEEIKRIVEQELPDKKPLITKNMLCAGTNEGSKDACFGDSGGPLVVEWRGADLQAGIVSWGARDGCGLTDLYGVYVRVSRYVDWVVSKIKS